jgi:hypothetical protein
MTESMPDPTPAELQIAQPTVPVSVDLMALTGCHHGYATIDQIQGSRSQDQEQTRQGLGLSDLA